MNKNLTKMSYTTKKPHKKKHIITSADRTLHRSRNSSVLTKKSLRINNRALAKSLSLQKRENRQLTREISCLIAERFELSQTITHLIEERRKYESGEMSVYLEKIKKLKMILSQVTGNVLVSVNLINSIAELFKEDRADSLDKLIADVEEVDIIRVEGENQDAICVNDAEQNGLHFSEGQDVEKENKEADSAEKNYLQRSPIEDPKATFNLSTISERSEVESRRSSIRRPSSITLQRRTKSHDRKRTKSREPNRNSLNDIWGTPSSLAEKIDESQPDILMDVSQKEDRNNLQTRRGEEMLEINNLLPTKIAKIVVDHENSDNHCFNRRGTFVVKNSLQIEPFPAVDPAFDVYVSKRKGKSSSNSSSSTITTEVQECVTKVSPTTSNDELNKQDQMEFAQLTDHEVKDMELTSVLQLTLEEKSHNNEKRENIKRVTKPTANEKQKSQSKTLNNPLFVVLDDNDVKRSPKGKRVSTAGSSKIRISDPVDDCYSCANVAEESIRSLGKFGSWKNKRSTGTEERQLDEDISSTPLQISKLCDVQNNNFVKNGDKDPKTPKSVGRLKKSVTKSTEAKNAQKEVMEASKTPRRTTEARKTPKRTMETRKTPKKSTETKKTPNVEKSAEKENIDNNGRSRRAKKIVDYKQVPLNAKIRRDDDGKVIVKQRVSDSSMRENESF